jgi:Flp pilus assembly protein TadG
LTNLRRHLSGQPRVDRGEISIETVILVPVVIFIVLIVVQAAVVMHGANAANHIAAQGAMSAARHGATTDHAVVAVAAAANSLGARLAAPPSVITSIDHVTVRVSVRVPQAVPVFAAQISREVSVPRERYIAYGER